jgi:hypothetical protein
MQTTNQILMIRPVNFVFNKETAINNAFQVQSAEADVQQKAIKEFDLFVAKLRSHDIRVTVVNDTAEPHTPDSIFPNNWISFHNDGTVVLYPMFAKNRRLERKPQVMDEVGLTFNTSKIIDLSAFENQNKFLEGTGSMVLDRDNRIAYACISPRTDKEVLNDFCRQLQYSTILFHAVDEDGGAIYHTNVMMCVADRFVVICLESINHETERKNVIDSINKSGKTIIDITYNQMNSFAGNMLQVHDSNGKKYLVMSTQAYRSLTDHQVKKLESFNEIIHSSLDTIERNGGGSARCMMAEVHLPVK